jgi:hypothetical protein
MNAPSNAETETGKGSLAITFICRDQGGFY